MKGWDVIGWREEGGEDDWKFRVVERFIRQQLKLDCIFG